MYGQLQTVGVFVLENEVFDGYTLFSPSTSNETYLIDNCGRLINSWSFTSRPGLASYLQPDGSLYRAGQLSNGQIHGGGAGGLIERFDWDNQLIWNYTYSTAQYRAHHDFQVLPNGNILLLAWELKTKSEAIENGRDSSKLRDNSLWPEHIVEIEPIGINTGLIVWEWHVWDHLIQDFDDSKKNYGIVSDHPEKINLNYIRPEFDGRDWLHANSIHYNEELDKILISVFNFDEVWIIDHSITTEEAAGEKGDLLFRWGNPQTYGMGTPEDKKLFGQHSAHWINQGLPDENKILIFNNGVDRPDSLFSQVVKIDPLFENGMYGKNSINTFLPDDFYWIYQADPPTNFYSRFMSGAQQLPNGNILVDDGAHGTFFELNEKFEKVWEYVNPVTIFGIATQGEEVINPDGQAYNTVFRATKYAETYPAFIGKNLSPQDPIELKPDLSLCSISSTDDSNNSGVSLYPNPTTDFFIIEGISGSYNLINLMGKSVLSGQIENRQEIDINNLKSGLYTLIIEDKLSMKVLVLN
jgi:hypothetical protein